MLGLFQADLPIGRRLWLFFIVALLSGRASSLIASASNTPSAFVVDIMMLFGSAIAFSIPGLILLTFSDAVLSVISRWKKEFRDPYNAAVSSHPEGYIPEFFNNVVFVIASALVLVGYGSSLTKITGVVGLVIILIGDIFDRYKLENNIVEMLTLKEASTDSLTATLFTGDGYKEHFNVTSDFKEQMAFLLRQGWKLSGTRIDETSDDVLFLRELDMPRFQYNRRLISRRHIRTIIEQRVVNQ